MVQSRFSARPDILTMTVKGTMLTTDLVLSHNTLYPSCMASNVDYIGKVKSIKINIVST